MSDTKETQAPRVWRGLPEEDAVRGLIEQAGPRPSVPNEDLVSIERAARTEWSRLYGDRRASRRRGGIWLGLAAAALAGAVGLAWWARKPETPVAGAPASPVGSIEVLTGVVRMRAAEGESLVSLTPDALRRSVPAGSELETSESAAGSGRVVLRMAGGASVRLDSGTRVRLASATLVELDRGAVYVDSGADPVSNGDLAVRTAAGMFEELGTQFEVRVHGNGATAVTRLRVREGRVSLARENSAVIASAGEQLTVRGNDLARQPVAVYGPDWDWVLSTAPMLEIEGVKVRRFLDWVAREAGWRVKLADRDTASIADSVVLHGSIRHLTAAEAPAVVLASCGLGHRAAEGTMFVFVAGQEKPAAARSRSPGRLP